MPLRHMRRAFLLMALLAAGCRPQPYVWHGSPYSDPQPAPAFALVDTAGKAFDSGEAHGSAVLLFFGYTFCPDVCPATTADVAWSMEQLGPLAERATFAFITVDPRRDTAEVLRRFLDGFNTRFVGLTGTPAQLESTRQAYGVYAEPEPSADPDTYLITHTSRLFLIDSDGLLVASYPFGTPRADLLADLQHVLESIP